MVDRIHAQTGINHFNYPYLIISIILQEVVLSPEQDTFYKANMFKNFGELGTAAQDLVTEFQEKSKITQNIQSIGLILFPSKRIHVCILSSELYRICSSIHILFPLCTTHDTLRII